ncbi:MAG: hypothetical protein ABIO63_06910 [Casimicrobiaceae bacterium]
MAKTRQWIARGLLVLLMGSAGVARAVPENGWWWNPSESGRGFFIEIQGTQVYLGGYFYADDGRALWLVSQGQTSTSTTYNGRLLSFANGQTLVGDYQPPGAAVDAGAISLVFTDDRHATLTWPGGTIAIERQYFDPARTVFQPKTGWWWNPAESGRGYSVEVQGNNLFLVGFMYDPGGNPVWYFSGGPLTSPTTYTGALLQFANGQTLTGPYKPPGTPATICTVTLDFTAPDEATMKLADALGAQEGAARTKTSKLLEVQPQFRPPTTPLPTAWEGEFLQNLVVDFGMVKSTEKLTGRLTWVTSFFGVGENTYAPIGSVDLDYSYELRSTLQNCDAKKKVTNVIVHTTDGELVVKANDQYSGSLTPSFDYTYTLVCDTVTPQGTVRTTTNVTNTADVEFLMKGNVVNGYIYRHNKPSRVAPGTTIETSWDFHVKN